MAHPPQGWAFLFLRRKHSQGTDKIYRQNAVEQLASPRVFRLSPFREMGQTPGVIHRFGGTAPLQEALGEIQRRLYAA
jgi:hypothetical protein